MQRVGLTQALEAKGNFVAMQAISRAVTGAAGLGAAFTFLVVGAVAISFALSAGIYLAAKGNGASTTAVGLLLFSPLVAGAAHSILSAIAVRRASSSKPPLMRTFAIFAAGAYCLLQFATLAVGLFAIHEFGL